MLNSGDEVPLGRTSNPRLGSLTDFEAQLVAFPLAPHDDMVDAAGAGLLYFLEHARRSKRVEVGGSVGGYAA